MILTIRNDNGELEEYLIVRLEEIGRNDDGEPMVEAKGRLLHMLEEGSFIFKFRKDQIVSVE